MFGTFHATLEASDADLGRARSYRIEAGEDLFGVWLVDVTYGRIGARGRTVRYVASDRDEARRIVRRSFQRRRTARKRIGVCYRIRELSDPGRWLSLSVESDSDRIGL